MSPLTIRPVLLAAFSSVLCANSALARAGIELRLRPAADGGSRFPSSFAELRRSVEAAGSNGQLQLALPSGSKLLARELVLPEAEIVFDAQRSSFCISGRIALGGSTSAFALAGAWQRAGGDPSLVLGLRPGSLPLSGWLPAGSAALLDGLDLGGSTLVFAEQAWPDAGALGSASSWFGGTQAALPGGWSLRGTLRAAALPPRLRGALGLDELGSIALEASIEGDPGILSGRPELRSLKLSAALPAALPAGLPDWIAPAEGEARQLALEYAPPRAPSARVSSRFAIAGHPLTLSMELDGSGAGRLAGTIEKLSLEDLARTRVLEGLPPEALAGLQDALGSLALELRDATLALEPASRTLTISAQVALRGMSSDFLYAVRIPEWNGWRDSAATAPAPEASGKRASLLAFRPTHFSIGKLVPRGLEVPGLKELFSAELQLPLIRIGSPALSLELPGIADGWRTAPAQKDDPESTSGFSLSGRLPTALLGDSGALKRLLGMLERLSGSKIDGLAISGSIGSSLQALRLRAQLPALSANASLPGLRAGDLSLSVGGDLSLRLSGALRVELGGETREFQVDTRIDGRGAEAGAASIEALSQGPWHKAFGVPWLELEDVRLRINWDGSSLSTVCAASLPVGKRRADVELALGGGDRAALSAKLDRATLGDLLEIAGRGGTRLAAELDERLELRDVGLSIALADPPRIVARAKASLFGHDAGWLLVLQRQPSGESALAFAGRLPELRLSEVVPALRGSPGDLNLPTPTLCFARGFGAAPLTLDDALVREWNGGQQLVVGSSIRLAAELPCAALPEGVRRAAGLGESGALALAGTLDADLSVLTGKGEVRALELSAVLPAGGGQLALPRWLSAVRGGQRSFVLAYKAPGQIRVGAGQELEADLGGAKRRFELQADAGTQGARLEARLLEPWPDAFGIPWLDLRDAQLVVEHDAGRISAQFDLAGKQASAELRLDGDGLASLSVGIAGLALADLGRSGIVGALPPEASAALERLLAGAALELREGSLTLDPRARTLTLAAQVALRGAPAEFLYVAELPQWSGSSAPAAARPAQSPSGGSLFAIRPLHFSLGQLIPAAGKSPAWSELAAIELELPTFSGGNGVAFPKLPELPGSWSGLLGRRSAAGPSDAPAEAPARGLAFDARLPALKLPAGGALARLFATLQSLVGGSIEGLDIHGSIGRELADLKLAAQLPPLRPQAKLPWLQGGELGLSITGEGSIALAGRISTKLGGAPLVFDLDGALGDSIEGRLAAPWERPFGMNGLRLEDVRLRFAAGAQGSSASCSAALALGGRRAAVEIAIESDSQASLAAHLDRASLADLLALGGKPGALQRAGLTRSLELSDLDLRLRLARETRLVVHGKASLSGKTSELLVGLELGAAEPRLGLWARLPALRLSDLAPGLRGRPADLPFPAVELGFAGGPDERGFVFAADESGSGAERTLQPGLRFASELRADALPEGLRRALGLDASSGTIALEGELDADLDVLCGGSAPRALHLRGVVPGGNALAQALPAWMSPVEGGPRKLVLDYEAPSRLECSSTREVRAELLGEPRRFTMVFEAGAQAGAAQASFRASMSEPWPAAFGISWLNLSTATLSGSLDGRTGSASVALEGAFTLGGRAGKLSATLTPGRDRSATGQIRAQLDRLALSDLADFGIAARLPTEALAVLDSATLEIREPTLLVTLGRERALSIGGTVSVRGMQSELAILLGGGSGGALAPRVLLAPEHLSLGKILPALQQSELLADLANLELPGLFAASAGEGRVDPEELPEKLRARMPPRANGAPGWRLARGLNLLSGLDLGALPREGMLAQVLARVGPALGIEASALELHGTLGARLADLRLEAALPPIRPARAPAWLESGTLSIVLTGQPSLGIEGKVLLHLEDDRLAFLLDSSIRREGVAPVIDLHGALEAEQPWKQPFGIRWLELSRVGVGIALDATGSVSPSISGALKIGRKDLEIAAKVRISPAGVPIGGMFLGQSEEGFALADLVELQRTIAAQVSGGAAPRPAAALLAALPDVALRGIELKLAPRDEPAEHVTRGLAIRGELFVPAKAGGPAVRSLAKLEFDVSAEGVRAEGALSQRQLGPIQLDDARVSLVVDGQVQRLALQGGAELLGHRQALDLCLSRQEVAFDAEADLGGKWKTKVHARAPLDFDNLRFQTAGLLPDDLLGSLRQVVGEEAGNLTTAAQAAYEAGEQAIAEVQRRRAQREQAAADLRKRLEGELAAARSAVQQAAQDAELAKRAADAAYESYTNTPDSKPVLKEARKKAWEVARGIYELGQNSKKAIHDARKARLAGLPPPERAPEVQKLVQEAADLRAQAETALRDRQTLGDALRPVLEFKKSHPGAPLLEIKKCSFQLDLAALARGGDLPIEIEVSWLGQPRGFRENLSFADVGACVRKTVRSLLPKLQGG